MLNDSQEASGKWTLATKGQSSSAIGYLSDLCAGGKRSEVGLRLSLCVCVWGGAVQQLTLKKVPVISQLCVTLEL